jgi:predicted transcriptional regulator
MTRTLYVTIGTDSNRTDLKETLGKIDAGEDVDPADPTLAVADIETFGKIFRPTNLTLLAAIAKHEPGSIRELARIVNRHPPEVHSNVHELVDYGLVELEDEGQSKRPVIRYDEIEADIPLVPRGDETSTAAHS